MCLAGEDIDQLETGDLFQVWIPRTYISTGTGIHLFYERVVPTVSFYLFHSSL